MVREPSLARKPSTTSVSPSLTSPFCQPRRDRAPGPPPSQAQLETTPLELVEDGQSHRFDAIYSAFGTTSQTMLATSLGARMDGSNRLFVDEHQATSVDGLFAAGDLVRGLNQISVAEGEAAIAATAIHNRLPKIFA